jgi:hypothetical protein
VLPLFVLTLPCEQGKQQRHFSAGKLFIGRNLLVLPFKDEAQTALFKDPVRTAL